MPTASTSRRSFLTLSTAAASAMVCRIVTEPMLAQARDHHPSADAIRIDSNENPLGPCVSAREAIVDITPKGGRYLDGLTEASSTAIAQAEAKPDYVNVTPDRPCRSITVCAFTSPQRASVTADRDLKRECFLPRQWERAS
jgi:hypothetical protein